MEEKGLTVSSQSRTVDGRFQCTLQRSLVLVDWLRIRVNIQRETQPTVHAMRCIRKTDSTTLVLPFQLQTNDLLY